MQQSELKLITASNIIRLRTEKGMTQAELGAKLNYSDKSVSKWERGEAIPDAFVLLTMGELFGVSVDYLLSSHDQWEPPDVEDTTELALERRHSADVIIAIVLIAIWTVALAVFVALWLVGILTTKVFVIALPVSLAAYLILMCGFGRTKHLQYIIAGLVLSLFIVAYVMLPLRRPWQLFLIAVPSLILVFLCCNIPKYPRRNRKLKNK